MTGKVTVFIVVIASLLSSFTLEPEWGFFGHRKINRMAVFTLPEDMLLFYKRNIDFVTEHAVDPDKRRYATKNEFARHYIDIDHWDTLPFPNVPRLYRDAILKYGNLYGVTDGDTTSMELTNEEGLELYQNVLYEDRFSAQIPVNPNQLPSGVSRDIYDEIFYDNDIVNYGIAPYFLEYFYTRLVWAFQNKDKRRILQISADIGHYISDIHVPLHTTLNYNGQLTDQIGIHAFWESRLPELYSEESYDFMVGKAEYIPDVRSYIWEIVSESHRLLPEVLSKEKEVKASFPEDQQFCYDERLERTIWTQCPEFSKAYHDSMGDMVERRMQESILSVGSFWYSAWIEAGQPDLNIMVDGVEVSLEEEKKKLNDAYQKGKIYGREHE